MSFGSFLTFLTPIKCLGSSYMQLILFKKLIFSLIVSNFLSSKTIFSKFALIISGKVINKNANLKSRLRSIRSICFGLNAW